MSNHSLSQDGGEASNSSSDENSTNHPQNKNAMMEVQALHHNREHVVASTRGTFAVIPSSNPNGAFRALSLSVAPLSSGVVQHGSNKTGQQQQHCTSRLPARGCDVIANLKVEEEKIRGDHNNSRANASPAHSSHGSFENVLLEGHVAIGETEQKILMLHSTPAEQLVGSDSPSSLPECDLDFSGGDNEDTDVHPANHIIVTTSKNALHATAPSHPHLQPQETTAGDGSDTIAKKDLVAIAPKESSPSASRLGTSTLPTVDSSVDVGITAVAPYSLSAEQDQTQENAMSILNNSKSNADQTISPGDTSNSSSPSKGKRKRSFSGSLKSGQSSGRWTREEHQAFLEGLKECGREWKKVAMRIPSRTSAQIRSHAQKYFAKVQRDQEHDHHLLTPSNSGLAGGNGEDSPAVVVSGEGGLLTGSTVATYPSNSLAPSVQRNVERIMADPRAAQQEVENTLEALRLRYRQLQQRLEERRNHRQHRRDGSSIGSLSSSNNIDGPPPSRASVMNIQNPRLSRKQFLESPRHYNSTIAGADENSSVSSNISSVAASRGNLGNEEIIALQVLGGDLPRGDSSVEDTASTTGIATVELDETSTTHGMDENTAMDVEEPPTVQESKTDESPIGTSFEDRNQGIPNHDKTC